MGEHGEGGAKLSERTRLWGAAFSPWSALVLALSSSLAANAYRADFRSQAYGAVVDADGPFETVDRFVEAIQTSGAQTVEDAIPLLPANVRSNYVLMYRSRSLQRATFQAPRAIAFEADASFIAAFNGGAQFKGGDSIELIQFKPDERRYEFRELSFAPGRAPTLSPPNPAKCLQCHQSAARRDVDPRPNWEPYFFWPGAYGSEDGNLNSDIRKVSNLSSKLLPSDAPLIAEQIREEDELKAFVAGPKSTNPRYRSLGEFKPANNLTFTQLLLWTNFRRVSRLAAQTPLFDIYKYNLLESTACSAYEDKFELRGLPEIPRALHAEAFERIRAADRDKRKFADYRYTLTRQLDSLFGARGVEMSDWSMDFKTGARFAFIERMGGPNENTAPFSAALALEFPQEEGLSCDELRARAQRAWSRAGERGIAAVFAAFRAAQAPKPALNGPALAAKCARCHDGDGAGPELPFRDEIRLAKALGSRKYPRGDLMAEIEYRISDIALADEAMPQDRPLSDADRKTLVDWLREASSQNKTP